MEITETDTLTERQKRQIVELWNKEYPRQLSHANLAEFKQYLHALADRHHLLLSDANGTVTGWLIYFIRDGKRCFAMLLDASLHGQGWGTKFLDLAKQRNPELNGWVIDNNRQAKRNGAYYKSPIGFYRKNGFEIQTNIQLKKKNINGIHVYWKSPDT